LKSFFTTGGITLIATIDHFQLLADTNNTIFDNDNLKRYSQLFQLKKLVRATDVNLRIMINKQRLFPLSIEDIESIINHMRINCTFYETFEEVPGDIPCVTTTRAARSIIQEARLRDIDPARIITIQAINTRSTNGGIPINTATREDLSLMDKAMSLENILQFYEEQTIMTSCITQNPIMPRGKVGTIRRFIRNNLYEVIAIECNFADIEDVIQVTKQLYYEYYLD